MPPDAPTDLSLVSSPRWLRAPSASASSLPVPAIVGSRQSEQLCWRPTGVEPADAIRIRIPIEGGQVGLVAEGAPIPESAA
jgi:hypothetical protein